MRWNYGFKSLCNNGAAAAAADRQFARVRHVLTSKIYSKTTIEDRNFTTVFKNVGLCAVDFMKIRRIYFDK